MFVIDVDCTNKGSRGVHPLKPERRYDIRISNPTPHMQVLGVTDEGCEVYLDLARQPFSGLTSIRAFHEWRWKPDDRFPTVMRIAEIKQ